MSQTDGDEALSQILTRPLHVISRSRLSASFGDSFGSSPVQLRDRNRRTEVNDAGVAPRSA